MPYTLDWYNEDHDIIVVRCTGRWTWEEVWEADTKIRELAAKSDRRMDCICDMSSSPWVPPAYAQNVEEITEVPYTNLHTVVYIASEMFRALLGVYESQFKALPYSLEFATSMNDAFKVILHSRRKNNAPPLRPTDPKASS